MAKDILVVDDEKDIRELVCGILEDEGYQTRSAQDGIQALEEIKKRQPNLVILDIWLGCNEKDGLKILETIKKDHPFVPVVMMSGHGTVETAVKALKEGAYDFVEKPFQTEKLLIVIEKAIASSHLEQEHNNLKKNSAFLSPLTGTSKFVQSFQKLLDDLSHDVIRVSIFGPQGCGKETLGRILHNHKASEHAPFISFNCGSLPAHQIEAVLFGADVQNLSDTTPRKIGLFEQAHNGTLYLENIHLLNAGVQHKMARFLQTNTFKRIGGQFDIEVSLNLITSSPMPLRHYVGDGSFRDDLAYRLERFDIEVPPLKYRSEDIPDIAQKMLDSAVTQRGLQKLKFGDDAMAIMQSYDWPGNIQQLRNIIDWVLIMNPQHDGHIVDSSLLPPELKSNISMAHTSKANEDVVVLPLKEAREIFEREYLSAQIHRFAGNVSKTAKFVGMERSALHRKLKSLGLTDLKG